MQGSESALESVAAFIVLMGVACWVTIIVERRVLRRYLPTIEQPILSNCVKTANISSFLVLSAALITFQLQ